MKNIVYATAILALSSVSAMAADLAARPMYSKAPAYTAPVASWTGLYIAGGGGYGFVDARTQEVSAATGTLVGAEINQAARGWFGTVQVGADYQFASPFPLFNNMVLGVFADYDWSDAHGNFTNGGNNVGLNSGVLKLKNSWAVGGRLGVTPINNLLAYVSGGYTEARFGSVSTFNFAAPFNFVSTTPANHAPGYFLGTGYEYNIGWLPGLGWKTEYRFAQYDTKTVAELNAAGTPNGSATRIRPYEQTIRSELVYRFNWGR